MNHYNGNGIKLTKVYVTKEKLENEDKITR